MMNFDVAIQGSSPAGTWMSHLWGQEALPAKIAPVHQKGPTHFMCGHVRYFLTKG